MSLSLLSLLISSAHAVPLSAVPVGGLVISEIQHNPDATADYRGEYVEIYNAHSDEIDINGLIVNSAGDTGFTVNQSITVAAGDYVVLAARSNSATNGGNTEVDFQYAYPAVRFGNNDSISISDGTTTFDSVNYNTSDYPIEAGAALILDNDTLDGSSNDSGQNWCTSGNVYGTGDFGTPGTANDGCSTVADLAVGDLVITEIMWDPTSVADYRGEWFEVYNASGTSLNLNGLVINSAGNSGHTITDDVVVAPGNQALLNVRVTTSLNGGTVGDYTYSYSQVGFAKTDSLSLVASGTTIDSVSYGFSSHSLENGKSISLASSVLSASGNDTASNWCASSSTYGDGDFGTPGLANDLCANVDGDGDGLIASNDCDDTDAAIGVFTYYEDLDSDTYGNDASTTTGCTAPVGYVEIGGDCNDSRSDINPDATEICDDVDNDCDNDIDDADSSVDTSTGTTFYADGDSDTYGDDLDTLQQCDSPNGYVSVPGDCNDNDAGINPGASDIIGNGIDENCDGVDNDGGDNDGDGFTVLAGDCNDNNAAINPDADEVCDSIDNDCDGDIDDADSETPTDASSWFIDSDGDGFAGSSNPTLACSQPANTFATAADCNDSDASVFPNASEIIADGIDQDCDSGDTCYADADNDGFRTDETVNSADLDCADSGEAGSAVPNTDCDDTSASINPNASEVCDSIDNDCDGDIDGADSSVDTSTGNTYFLDSDNDLYGDAANSTWACSKPFGYVPNSDDCDDTDYNIKPLDIDGDGFSTCTNDCDETNVFTYPGAAETESVTDCMTDADEDGYGDTSAPAGGVAGTDCDDDASSVNPGADEVCDGIDNDCDTFADDLDPEGATDATTWYHDNDSDTFGDTNDSLTTCTQPTDYITDDSDCDDDDAAINPSATEVCDGVDNDCDNDIDDDDSSVTGQSTFFVDADLDGFAGSTTVDACIQPADTYLTDDDCDDSSNVVFPGATEICDGLDNDCDTDVDEGVGGNTFFADTDNDTFGDPSNTIDSCTQPAGYVADNTDCDDNAVAVNPNASEVCDGIDNDCDNDIDDDDSSVTGQSTFFVDADLDGFAGSTTVDACIQPADTYLTDDDCDDSSNVVFPGATEICDGLDNDCDTDVDEGVGGNTFFADTDNDTFGDPSNTIDSCTQPAGYVADNTDCDDNSASINPNATEICLDGIDSDCDNTDSLGVCEGDIADSDFTINGVTATGGSTGDRIGQALSYAGNVTGDTTNDFVLGSRWAGGQNGAAYIYAGSSSYSGSTTTSSANITITGQNTERFGFDVAGGTNLMDGITADFNGDGNDDLLIGAPNADVSGSAIGSAYMFYGPLSADTTSSAANVVFTGQFGQDPVTPSNHNAVNTGYSVAFVGDVNNDGIADIAIGDPSKKNRGSTNGEAYLIFGRADTFDGNGTQLTAQYEGSVSLNLASWKQQFGREILSDGDDREQMGAAIDAIGDVNGDGIDDLMVGAYRWDASSGNNNDNSGGVFVWYGGTSLTNLTELTVSHSGASNTADITFVGANSGDQVGRSASGAGDFDGDGVNDIVIGSEHANSAAGAVYVVKGTSTGTITLNPSNGAVLTAFTGENAGDGTGRWVSTLGNVDGDAEGTSDILVGSKYASVNGSESGAMYVILGGSGVTGTNSFSSAEVLLTGAAAGDRTGGNVSGMDDMDGDGISEILVGSELTNGERGAVQLIFGNTFQ